MGPSIVDAASKAEGFGGMTTPVGAGWCGMERGGAFGEAVMAPASDGNSFGSKTLAAADERRCENESTLAGGDATESAGGMTMAGGAAGLRGVAAALSNDL